MKNIRIKGFTLVELSITMVIAGLLFTAFVSLYSAQRREDQMSITRERMEDIQLALREYAKINLRYPCVADPSIALTTSGYGAATNCAAAVGGGVVEAGPAGNKVRIGSVPVNTLRLSSDHQKDGYGNRFTFAMSVNLTAANSIPAGTSPDGSINIIDAAGTTVLPTAGTAQFVILSHGPTGVGARTMSGGTKLTCPAATTLENENCDNDGAAVATFRAAAISETSGNNFFDDTIMSNNSIVVTATTLADKLAICSGKRMFYVPSDGAADADGCVGITGMLEGACIERQTEYDFGYLASDMDATGFFVSDTYYGTSATLDDAYVISAPATVTGASPPRCACPAGYTLRRLGSWTSPIDNHASACATCTYVRADTLFTCTRN